MQMVQIEQLILGLFPYNNLSINSQIFNMSTQTFNMSTQTFNMSTQTFNMSTQTSDNNKRIVKNTLLLYF